MIELKNVSLSYNKVYFALYDINLSIKNGEVIVVSGLGGSGKSALLRAIAGLDKITKGEILIDGVNLEDVDFISSVSVGYLSQKPVFFESKTVYQNLAWALKIRKVDKKLWEEKVDEVLKEFNLLDIKKKKINKLTKTEKKLVQIARLMLRPLDILLCDDLNLYKEDDNFEVLCKAYKKLISKDKKHKITMFISNSYDSFKELITREIRLDSGSIQSDSGVAKWTKKKWTF